MWASKASETLYSGVKLRIGNICLYNYNVDLRMLFVHWPHIFVLARYSTPSQNSLNRILWFIDHYPYHLEIELFTALNSFVGTLKTPKLTRVPFLLELVVVLILLHVNLMVSISSAAFVVKQIDKYSDQHIKLSCTLDATTETCFHAHRLHYWWNIMLEK